MMPRARPHRRPLLNITGESEAYLFWKHLANAGLIEGSYSGINAQTLGVTVPPSKVSMAYWVARNGLGYTSEGGTTVMTGDTTDYGVDYGRNEFRFRNATSSNATANVNPLKPEELWNIDTKIDDGLPGSGKLIAQKGDGVNAFCTTAAGVAPPGDAGSTYKLSNSNKDCFFDYGNAF